ncbi:MAG: transglutaminase-like domain-containing protein [Actinomycetota bacterium]|nr:transglutaminase-like domain-containing protein [Actinomycetota bacterium]
MDPTAAFVALVAPQAGAPPLDEGALLIAAHGRPGLDLAAELDRLDDLARRCPDHTVNALRWLLFNEVGVRGDIENYRDPRNSFLDQVLDRGRGIPITLSVLMIEVGRRIGVELDAVGMPGHFLVRTRQPALEIWDPFGGGRPLSVDDCRRMYHTRVGPDAPWSLDLLRPTPSRAVLARMLANLAGSYADLADTAGRQWVADLRAAIPGQSPGEKVRLTEELTELGRFDLAAEMLEELATDHAVDDLSRTRLRRRAHALRARLN